MSGEQLDAQHKCGERGEIGGESEVNKAEHTRENLKNILLYQTLELAH